MRSITLRTIQLLSASSIRPVLMPLPAVFSFLHFLLLPPRQSRFYAVRLCLISGLLFPLCNCRLIIAVLCFGCSVFIQEVLHILIAILHLFLDGQDAPCMAREAKKLENDESTKEEYDDWRYKYPELDTHQNWAKVYPQELFDFIDDCTKKAEKEKIDIKKTLPIFSCHF